MTVYDFVKKFNTCFATINGKLENIEALAAIPLYPNNTAITDGHTTANVHPNALYMVSAAVDASIDRSFQDIIPLLDEIKATIETFLKEREESLDSEIDEICKKGDGDD